MCRTSISPNKLQAKYKHADTFLLSACLSYFPIKVQTNFSVNWDWRYDYSAGLRLFIKRSVSSSEEFCNL